MANSKISDIANGIELGDNERQSMITGETGIKAGMAVKKFNADRIIKITAAEVNLNFYGIVKERQDTDLDTAFASGVSVDVVRSGFAAAFIEDPTADKLAGESFMAHPAATAGSLCIMATGDFATDQCVAEIVEDISNGDTVAIIKLISK